MLDGVNDSLHHAKALIRLLEGTPSKVNLIPFQSFPGTHYQASPAERVEAFRMGLKRSGNHCYHTEKPVVMILIRLWSAG